MDTMNLDAELTIAQVVLYFGGDVSYRCVDGWVRRGLLKPTRCEADGLRIRLGDALEAECATRLTRRGRPRRRQVLASRNHL
jgi:hypothetical protein